jgi:hypothetical protein
MDRWRTQTARWLSNEERHLDDAAETAFAEVFTALPVVEPSADFVVRAVEATWVARARRRRTVAVAGLAACGLVVATVSILAYSLMDMVGGWLLTSATSMATTMTVSALMATTSVAQWWSVTAQAAGAVASIIAMPQGAVAFVAVELVGVVALFMLQRLLRAELKFRNPGPLCC